MPAIIAILLILAGIYSSGSTVSTGAALTDLDNKAHELIPALNKYADDLDRQAANLDATDSVKAAVLRLQAKAGREKANEIRDDFLPRLAKAQEQYKLYGNIGNALSLLGAKFPVTPAGVTLGTGTTALSLLLGASAPSGDVTDQATRFLEKLDVDPASVDDKMKRSIATEIFRREVEKGCVQNGEIDYACLSRVKNRFAELLGSTSGPLRDIIAELLNQVKERQTGQPVLDGLVGTYALALASQSGDCTEVEAPTELQVTAVTQQLLTIVIGGATKELAFDASGLTFSGTIGTTNVSGRFNRLGESTSIDITAIYPRFQCTQSSSGPRR